jgi:DNA polymerase-3 subunit alpha
MAKRLNAIDQNAIAITEHGNMCSIAVFDKELSKAGIKLIAGNEMYVASLGADDTSTRDTAHITLISMSMKGYKNLCKLHTLSWQRPAYYFNARTDLDLIADYSEDLICLSGCLGGILLKPLLKGDAATAESRLKALKQIFGKRFYLELQDHQLPEDDQAMDWLFKMAAKHKIPLVATNDAHYVNKDDWTAHDMVIACGMGQRVGDPNRQISYKPMEFYLKSYDEMAERFDPPELKMSKTISDQCEPLKLASSTFHIPTYKPRPSNLIASLYGK